MFFSLDLVFFQVLVFFFPGLGFPGLGLVFFPGLGFPGLGFSFLQGLVFQVLVSWFFHDSYGTRLFLFLPRLGCASFGFCFDLFRCLSFDSFTSCPKLISTN